MVKGDPTLWILLISRWFGSKSDPAQQSLRRAARYENSTDAGRHPRILGFRRHRHKPGRPLVSELPEASIL
jgi:hypothetical protein